MYEHDQRVVNNLQMPQQQDQLAENAAPQQQQLLDEKFQSPLRIHQNSDLTNVQLMEPDLNKIEAAYGRSGFEYLDSDGKRQKYLSGSQGRFHLQQALAQKMAHPVAGVQLREITTKDAMSMNDEKLVKNHGRYGGEAAAYLNFRYRLMKNRYYALLPIEEIKKYTRSQLLGKLKEEYGKQPPDAPDQDLITFYEDLIRMKILEDAADEKKQDRPNPENPPVAFSRDEINKNRDAYRKNVGYIEGLHISDDEKSARKKAMKSVMAPTAGNNLWKDKKTGGINMKQKEGVRSILAWMYRNCNKSSVSKEPFVYQLTQAEPEQVLFMFYLIENDRVYAPDPGAFLKAQTEYVPDLNNFKDKLVASKLKFWKRIGSDSSDSVIDWSKLGMAARFALNCEPITDFKRYNAEAERLTGEINKPENENRKEELLYDMLLQKGNILLTLYKAAGLTPDMSPDLIEDPLMRQRVFTTITDFGDGLRMLSVIRRAKAQDQGQPLPQPGEVRKVQGKDFDDGAKAKAKEKALADKEKSYGFGDGVEDFKTILDHGGKLDTLLTLIGDPVSDLTSTQGYELTANGAGALASFIGLVSSIVSAVKLGKGATLTAADHTAQAFSVTSDLVGGLSGTVKSGSDLLGTFVDLGNTTQETLPWYGSTTIKTASESFSTVSGGIKFVSGAVSVVTGALTTAAGAIEIGRGVSSRKDIKRAREAMDNERKSHMVLNRKQTEEREALKRMLDHRDRTITDEKRSGTMKVIGGTLAMIGGALTMSGVFAPIGMILSLGGAALGIAVNVFYARHRRRLTRMQAVDDAFQIESIIEAKKTQDPALENLSGKELEKFKAEIRQAELGRLGYATYKEAFADLMKINANMLYEHVFNDDENTEEYKMFRAALDSLGMKVRKKGGRQKENIPTKAMIYAKLMG